MEEIPESSRYRYGSFARNSACAFFEAGVDISILVGEKGAYVTARRSVELLVFPFLGVILPLAPLFNLNASFNNDWVNHSWIAAYGGEHFLRHSLFSPTLNSTAYLGIPFPIFYGYLLYPLLGVLSSFFGSVIAIRLAIFFIFFGQFLMVYQLFCLVEFSKRKALCIALLWNWSIYPLTNLYHRGALPEFFATHFLAIGICSLCYVFLTPKSEPRLKFGFLSVLMVTLSAGSHPITALLGGLLMLGLALVFRVNLKGLGKSATMGLVASLCILSPWIYAVLKLLPQLDNINLHFTQQESFDAYWVRFSPFPLDLNSFQFGTQMDTPFLDTQLNISILVLVLVGLVLALKRRKQWLGPQTGLIVFSGMGFLLVCFLSVQFGSQSSVSIWLIKHFLKFIQFSYRFTTYANLFLLLALLGLRSFRQTSKEGVVLAIALSLGSVGVCSKIQRAFFMRRFDKADVFSEKSLVELPQSFYSVADYVARQGGLPPPRDPLEVRRIYLPVDLGASFGGVRERSFEMENDGWLETNIYSFPWNRLLVDGELVPTEKLAIVPQVFLADGRYLHRKGITSRVKVYAYALPLSKGKHQIGYRFVPEKSWIFLRKLSGVSELLLILVVIYLFVIPARQVRGLVRAEKRLFPETRILRPQE